MSTIHFGINKVLLLTLILHSLFRAQPLNGQDNGLFLKITSGDAALHFRENNAKTQKNCFVLGFSGGYIPSRWMRVGLDMYGYLLEPYGNFNTSPEKGESISCYALLMQFYPLASQKFFIGLESGFSKYTNMHPNAYSSKGYSLKAGLGYLFNLLGKTEIGLEVYYGQGNFGNVVYPGIRFTDRHFNTLEITANVYFIRALGKNQGKKV